MKYLIITKIPPQRTLLGTSLEKTVFEETEADGDQAIEKIKDGLRVPLGGECLIVPLDEVTIVRSRVINEVVS